jgi:hypothetical protein
MAHHALALDGRLDREGGGIEGKAALRIDAFTPRAGEPGRPVDPIAVADQRVVPEVPGLAQRMRAPVAEHIKEVVSEGPEAIAIILLLGGFSS